MSILWIIFVVIWLAFLWSRRKYYMLAWKLKGPIGYPLVGNIDLLNPKKVLQYTKLLAKYKSPTAVWIGPMFLLYVVDAENAEKVLRAPECVNKSVLYKSISRVAGDGLMSNSNPKWSLHRKLLNPVFNHRNLMSFFPIFNSETDVLRVKLGKFADTGTTIDIRDMYQRYTLNTACQTVMGTEMHIQTDDKNKILDAYNCGIECTAKMMLNPFYTLDFYTKIFDYKFYKAREDSMKRTKDFVEGFLSKKIHQHNSQAVKSENNNSFIKSESVFIDHVAGMAQSGILPLDEVIDESNHFIVAAYETTSTAIYYITVLLAIHLEWQDKLYEQIKEVFPNKNFDVCFENLADVPLVEMVINETLRLLTVAPLYGRQVESDFQLNDDILLPKGTNIVIDSYRLHTSSKYWGPDALEFNPEHFLPDAVKNRHPYAFVPFSKGFRNCIGWRYAYLLLKVFVIKLFRNYRFTTTTKMEEIELYFNVTSHLAVNPVVSVQSRAN